MAPNVDEIRCRTRLTAAQLAAMLAPSPGFFVFAACFCLVWIIAIPASKIATTLALGFASLIVLKLVIFGTFMFFNTWQVRFNNDFVEFRQGGRLVASSKLPLEDGTFVSIIETRLFPRMLRLTKSDGTNLDTLYGVSKSDLETVTARMQNQNAK